MVGRKIGLTSLAVQQQLGVDQPDFGVLFEDMQFADGDTVPMTRLLQPRIEAEVAFVLRADLTEDDLSLDGVRDAVDYAVAALEVADSRVEDWKITFADTVADNASAGVYVLGGDRRTLDEVVPRTVAMRMEVTGQEDSTGTGEACLGDPLLALQWLAVKARALGDPLRAGQVVLSGALGPMRPVAPGATATAEITGFGAHHGPLLPGGVLSKTKVAVVGSGNIGTDLMIKVLRTAQHLEMGAMVGIDPASDGLARAARLGVPTTHEGVEGLMRCPVSTRSRSSSTPPAPRRTSTTPRSSRRSASCSSTSPRRRSVPTSSPRSTSRSTSTPRTSTW